MVYMSNGPVKTSNYQTCVCGQVCKGRAALANHAARCQKSTIRRRFDSWCWELGLPFVGDNFFNANFDAIAAKFPAN